ncbi:hypothetical protein D3C71_1563430 [compost metagenome]
MLQQLPAHNGDVMGGGVVILGRQTVTVGKMRVLQPQLFRPLIHQVDKSALRTGQFLGHRDRRVVARGHRDAGRRQLVVAVLLVDYRSRPGIHQNRRAGLGRQIGRRASGFLAFLLREHRNGTEHPQQYTERQHSNETFLHSNSPPERLPLSQVLCSSFVRNEGNYSGKGCGDDQDDQDARIAS